MKSTALPLLFVSGAYAWGNLGHSTLCGDELLGTTSVIIVTSKLKADYSSTLGSTAATWADSVKETTGWSWSKQLHFVDANDNFPTSCSVDYTRDCASPCILSAISNYTSRIVSSSLSSTQTTQALLFLDHFIGDIGQPLHDEAWETGGNDIDVKCNGKKTNLHAAWDTGMIETYLDANFDGDEQSWATSLVERIQSGDFAEDASSWISCSSTTDPITSRSVPWTIKDDIARHLATRNVTAEDAKITPLACPLVWAQDANVYDCSFVATYSNFKDLCNTNYIAGAMPIIESQLAKQGYRLAAWLNVLFDGETLL